MFNRPARGGPALAVQDAGPLHHHVPGRRAKLFHVVTDVIRQMRTNEGTHLSAKRLVFRLEFKLHQAQPSGLRQGRKR